MKCDRCLKGEIVFEETPKSIHYGKDICNNCGKWFCWIKNPESVRTKNPNRIMKLSPKRVWEFHKMNNHICFFCLRTKEQLGFSETMTVDHIEELDKGGQDIIENQQVLCSACHKLKNWARLYMNWHLNGNDNGKS